MLVVNITYDAVTRLMAVDEISTGQPNRVVGTTADNNGTMLHFTFIDFDNSLELYSKSAQFGSVLVDAEHDTYRPPMMLDENNNVIIPDYIMSHVLRNTLTVQLVFKHSDAETGDVTEFRSLNILKLRVEPAIPTGDMPDPQEVIGYKDIVNGVLYDADTSTFTFKQIDGTGIVIKLSDLAEDHYDVPTQADLTGPLTEGAENGDTATAEDTGVWYKLYGSREVLENWKVMTGNATINGVSTGSPVFYAPHISGEEQQYLESMGESGGDPFVEKAPVWKTKVTSLNLPVTGQTDAQRTEPNVPTTGAVKVYTDDNFVHKTGGYTETVTGEKTFSDDVTFNDVVTFKDDVTAEKNVSVVGDASVTGDADLNGTLNVAEKLTVESHGADITGDTAVTGDISVSGDATIGTAGENNSLTVNGKTNLDATDVDGLLKVDEIQSLSSGNNVPVTIKDSLVIEQQTVVGTDDADANLVVKGSISSTKGIQTAGNIQQAVAPSGQTRTATFQDTTLKSLSVTGTSQFNDNVTVATGKKIISPTVDTATIMNSDVNNGVQVDDTLEVTGKITGSAGADVTGDVALLSKTGSKVLSTDANKKIVETLGAEHQVLTSSGTAPTWQTPAAPTTSGGTLQNPNAVASVKSVYDEQTARAAADTALDNAKAPVSHASNDGTYGLGTDALYGHVKVDDTMSEDSVNPVRNSVIRAFVNSSIGTATANFLGTYDAKNDLEFTQSVIDAWTDPPSASVETAVGTVIKTYLTGQSISQTNNDYVFVSVNQSGTVDTDWFWRFKYDGTNWLYEYTLNNSSFSQSQWDAINSLVTNSGSVGVDVQTILTHMSNTDIHVTTANKDAWNAKYDLPSGGVPYTDLSSGVQASLDKADAAVPANTSITGATKCKITYDSKGLVTAGTDLAEGDIPALSISKTTGLQTALDNKLDDTQLVDTFTGHTSDDSYIPSAKLTKTSLDGKVTGPGSAVSDDVAVFDGATGKLIKDSGKTLGASIPAPAVNQDEGKAIIVNPSGTGFIFGEAGKVDDVKVNGTSVVSNKEANITVGVGVLTLQTNGGSSLGTFSANATSDNTITLPNGTVQLLNQSVTFVSDNTYEEFPYRASVLVTGVTSSTYAEVTYSEEQATSLNFATFIETATDTIYLYSRTNVGTVTIPTISIGMDYSDITIDATPTSGSGNAVSSGGVYTALATKQDTLTFDNTPTDGSSNPVTSDGVYEGLKALYPIGSIYMNASNNANPSTLFGFGTWEALAPGRVLMGAGNSSYVAGHEYGEYTHTLTVSEMPKHGHNSYIWNNAGTLGNAKCVDSSGSALTTASSGARLNSGTTDWVTGGIPVAGSGNGDPSGYTDFRGDGVSHNNVQPSLVVYMWVRTA